MDNARLAGVVHPSFWGMSKGFFLIENTRALFTTSQHGFVSCPEGYFAILNVHADMGKVLDVTLKTTDTGSDELLRKRMGIPRGYPLRILYNTQTQLCTPNRLLQLCQVLESE